MKNSFLFLICFVTISDGIFAQTNQPSATQQKVITALIDRYSEARENRDTALLKTILTADVDQLVSTGEWRTGIGTAIEGMMRSSANSPGTRLLIVDKIRMAGADCAIVDCRYEITNADNSTRKMWSSFVVVKNGKDWKITAIRNMLPAGN